MNESWFYSGFTPSYSKQQQQKNSTEPWVQMKSKYSTWEWKSLSWRKFFFSPSQGRQHFFLLFLLYINTLICIKWKRITINHCTFLPLRLKPHTHISKDLQI